jgi:hypothetical protein
MQQNTSWEADSCSASQDIPCLMEPKGSLLFSQEPITSPYREPEESSLHLPILSP